MHWFYLFFDPNSVSCDIYWEGYGRDDGLRKLPGDGGGTSWMLGGRGQRGRYVMLASAGYPGIRSFALPWTLLPCCLQCMFFSSSFYYDSVASAFDDLCPVMTLSEGFDAWMSCLRMMLFLLVTLMYFTVLPWGFWMLCWSNHFD